MNQNHCWSVVCLLLAVFLVDAIAVGEDRPNILVIMVDDLGFSDLGCYGSEIETPTLDRLANDGLRFSQFYNTAKCHSSRVSLLTGQYCLAAGDTQLSHAVTSAEVLRDSGYFTAMTGKWHLKKQPTDFGFDRYFGHLSGACNYFYGDRTFRLNGQSWTVPRNGFYTTVADVDFGLKFVKEARAAQKPWYLYVAFNAPHAPLQALKQDYQKYEGRYDKGWDEIRDARIHRQRDLKLLPDGFIPSARPDHVPAWQDLTVKRQEFEIKRITTLAAMIDRVDQEVGRLVQHLKATGQLDNTFIWFVSDNGACPYDRTSRKIEAEPTSGDVSWSDSTGWAWARNSPFRFYKQNQFEGGIGTPAIVHWPVGLKVKPGSINRSPAHLIDILPTISEAAGAPIPASHPERSLRPVSGQSLLPVFAGKVIDRKEPLHFLFAADRAIRDGNWKAVSFRSGPWKLYDLATDRTERIDLAAKHPNRLQEMVKKWHEMAKDNLHAHGRSIAAVQSEPVGDHPEWTNFAIDPANSQRGSRRHKGRSKAEASGISLRARKNTQLKIEDGVLKLTFSGDDPGLAFDRLPADLFPGPYQLTFDVSSRGTGSGDVFFTTDRKISLPKGEQVTFELQHDDEWHSHSLSLTTDKTLKQLRLDFSDEAGTAKVRNLQLKNAIGQTLSLMPGQN